jgi:DNA repair protein RecO (recombination protein O)
VLLPGNLVAAEYRARTADQLPHLGVELTASRAGLHSEPLPAAAIEWVTALTATALPEEQPYPRVYQALDGLLAAVDAAPAARGWAAALVRYELLVLAELGFGLDLAECAATGSALDLAFVSPRSGRAISAGAGEPYRSRLFVLPSFLSDGGSADWGDIQDGLRLTGHFLARDLLIERQAGVLAARERLLERLKRVTASA